MSMLMTDLAANRPAVNIKTGKLVIALAGASRSGKSTFSDYIAEHLCGIRLSFANKLRESAYKAGWDGSKDPEQRAKFFQELSQREKDMYGESYYADCTIAAVEQFFKNNTESRVVVIDDLRHFVELVSLLKYESESVQTLLVNFNNPTAEAAWFNAVIQPEDRTTRWAHHRSELEWRSFRSYLQEFENRMPPEKCSSEISAAWLERSLLNFNNFLRRASSLYYEIEHSVCSISDAGEQTAGGRHD